MLGLGNWVDNGKFSVINYPVSTFSMYLLPSISPFFFFVLVDSLQSWPDLSASC